MNVEREIKKSLIQYKLEADVYQVLENYFSLEPRFSVQEIEEEIDRTFYFAMRRPISNKIFDDADRIKNERRR